MNNLREALEEIDRQEEAQRIKELGEQLKELSDVIIEMREEALKGDGKPQNPKPEV